MISHRTKLIELARYFRWKFATENNVILVDEYDQINIDIEPFLALPSKEMLSRARFLAANPSPNQFNLNVKGGKVLTTGPQRETYRAHDAANLLSLFSKYIEDMPITVSTFSSLRDGTRPEPIIT